MTERELATLRQGLDAMAQIARGAGAQEIMALGTPPLHHGADEFAPGGEARAFAAFLGRLADFDFRPNRGPFFSAHQMGTARAGADRRRHACDPMAACGPGRAQLAAVTRGRPGAQPRPTRWSTGSTSPTGRCSRRGSA